MRIHPEILKKQIIKHEGKALMLDWLIENHPKHNAAIMHSFQDQKVALMAQWADEFVAAEFSNRIAAGWYLLVPDISVIMRSVRVDLGLLPEPEVERRIVSIPSSYNKLSGPSTGTVRQMSDPRKKSRRSW